MQHTTTYPWSLRKKFVFFLCFVLPPIGFIYILANRNVLHKSDIVLYVLFSVTTMSLWLSIMLFDRNFWMILIHDVICLIIIAVSNLKNKEA
ncbi:hypothetical protein [Bacillus cereus]|uniref:hypothetical protein n=1 Tax=Bacillus cereus TaxID=1396 RepID=UPI001FF90C00|nr:hypothetical protein [Bacillus cereus]